MDRTQLKRQIDAVLPTIGEVTFYELLGVPQNATEEQIRSAFRDRARIFHVDGYTEDLGELREPMQRIFGEMSKAHTTLTSELAREEYDASLELAGRGVPTDVRTIFGADEAFRSGRRLVERSSFREAYQQLRKAVDMNPAEPDYWAYMYWAEFGCLETDADGVPISSRRVQDIVSNLVEVADANEHCFAAHVFLGHMFRVQGDVDEAQRRYKAALAIDKDNLEAQSSLRLLNRRKSQKVGLFERWFGKKG